MTACPYCQRYLAMDSPLCDCEDHCVECCPYLSSADGDGFDPDEPPTQDRAP